MSVYHPARTRCGTYIFQSLHVLGDVFAENVGAERLAVQLLHVSVVTRESLLVVRHVETTVRSTLDGTKETRASRGSARTNVEEDLEWSAFAVDRLDNRVASIRFGHTFVRVGHVQFGQHSSRKEQTRAVG